MQILLTVPEVHSVKSPRFVLRSACTCRRVHLPFHEQILSQRPKAQKWATRHEVIQYDGVSAKENIFLNTFVERRN